jgi:hypothetical protein
VWVNTYDKISWEEFLINISGIQETGRWIKEVIAVELEKSKEK